jgi:CubicO group peptidase (beta-lactamase class C family)
MDLTLYRVLPRKFGRMLLVGAALALFAPVTRAAVAANTPESHGFSSERLKRLDAVIQEQIDQKHMAGAVMFIARDGQPVHFRAYGQQEIETSKPMPTDAIFRIASMSKALTATAIMMLYEEGKFMLHDPVSKYIPAFAKSSVAVSPPAGSPADVKYVLVPAKRPIQIRDLLTHTAGLTYGDGLAVDLYKQANVYGWYFANHDEPIAAAIDRLAA